MPVINVGDIEINVVGNTEALDRISTRYRELTKLIANASKLLTADQKTTQAGYGREAVALQKVIGEVTKLSDQYAKLGATKKDIEQYSATLLALGEQTTRVKQNAGKARVIQAEYNKQLAEGTADVRALNAALGKTGKDLQLVGASTVQLAKATSKSNIQIQAFNAAVGKSTAARKIAKNTAAAHTQLSSVLTKQGVTIEEVRLAEIKFGIELKKNRATLNAESAALKAAATDATKLAQTKLRVAASVAKAKAQVDTFNAAITETAKARTLANQVATAHTKLTAALTKQGVTIERVKAAEIQFGTVLRKNKVALATNTREIARAAAQAALLAKQKLRIAASVAKAKNQIDSFNSAVTKTARAATIAKQVAAAHARLTAVLRKQGVTLAQVKAAEIQFGTTLRKSKIALNNDTRAVKADAAETVRLTREKIRVSNALARANLAFARVRETLQESGGSIRRLTRAHTVYTRRLQNTSTSVTRLARSQRLFNKTLIESRTRLVALKATPTLFKNIGSSAILAYGPLSGVGARLTAFSAIASRTGVAVALGVAGFIGVAVALGKLSVAAVKARLEFDKITAGLESVLGSSTLVSQELGYLSGVADDLGINLRVAALGYSRLVAASRGTSLQGEGVREVFEAVAVTSRALSLDEQDTAGILKAIEQIISKGNVQAEELRGQLGDRLIGSVNLAAQSLGIDTVTLNKLLKQGGVDSVDFLEGFSKTLLETYDEQAGKQSSKLAADLERLGNSAFRFALELDNFAGISDAFQSFIQGLTGFIDTITRFLIYLGGDNPLISQGEDGRRFKNVTPPPLTVSDASALDSGSNFAFDIRGLLGITSATASTLYPEDTALADIVGIPQRSIPPQPPIPSLPTAAERFTPPRNNFTVPDNEAAGLAIALHEYSRQLDRTGKTFLTASEKHAFVNDPEKIARALRAVAVNERRGEFFDPPTLADLSGATLPEANRQFQQLNSRKLTNSNVNVQAQDIFDTGETFFTIPKKDRNLIQRIINVGKPFAYPRSGEARNVATLTRPREEGGDAFFNLDKYDGTAINVNLGPNENSYVKQIAAILKASRADSIRADNTYIPFRNKVGRFIDVNDPLPGAPVLEPSNYEAIAKNIAAAQIDADAYGATEIRRALERNVDTARGSEDLNKLIQGFRIAEAGTDTTSSGAVRKIIANLPGGSPEVNAGLFETIIEELPQYDLTSITNLQELLTAIADDTKDLNRENEKTVKFEKEKANLVDEYARGTRALTEDTLANGLGVSKGTRQLNAYAALLQTEFADLKDEGFKEADAIRLASDRVNATQLNDIAKQARSIFDPIEQQAKSVASIAKSRESNFTPITSGLQGQERAITRAGDEAVRKLELAIAENQPGVLELLNKDGRDIFQDARDNAEGSARQALRPKAEDAVNASFINLTKSTEQATDRLKAYNSATAITPQLIKDVTAELAKTEAIRKKIAELDIINGTDALGSIKSASTLTDFIRAYEEVEAIQKRLTNTSVIGLAENAAELNINSLIKTLSAYRGESENTILSNKRLADSLSLDNQVEQFALTNDIAGPQELKTLRDRLERVQLLNNRSQAQVFTRSSDRTSSASLETATQRLSAYAAESVLTVAAKQRIDAALARNAEIKSYNDSLAATGTTLDAAIKKQKEFAKNSRATAAALNLAGNLARSGAAIESIRRTNTQGGNTLAGLNQISDTQFTKGNQQLVTDQLTDQQLIADREEQLYLGVDQSKQSISNLTKLSDALTIYTMEVKEARRVTNALAATNLIKSTLTSDLENLNKLVTTLQAYQAVGILDDVTLGNVDASIAINEQLDEHREGLRAAAVDEGLINAAIEKRRPILETQLALQKELALVSIRQAANQGTIDNVTSAATSRFQTQLLNVPGVVPDDFARIEREAALAAEKDAVRLANPNARPEVLNRTLNALDNQFDSKEAEIADARIKAANEAAIVSTDALRESTKGVNNELAFLEGLGLNAFLGFDEALSQVKAIDAFRESLVKAGVAQDDVNAKTAEYTKALMENQEAQQAFKNHSDLLKSLEGVANSAFDSIASGIGDVIVNGEKLGDTFDSIIKKILADLITVYSRSLITSALGNSFSALGAVGAFSGAPAAGGIATPAPGSSVVPFNTFTAAAGGSFQVGGSGGLDSQLVGLRASPGELVNISKGSARAGNSDAVTVNVYNNATGTNVQVEEHFEAGQKSIDVIIDQVVAAKLNDPTSRSSRALRQGNRGRGFNG